MNRHSRAAARIALVVLLAGALAVGFGLGSRAKVQAATAYPQQWFLQLDLIKGECEDRGYRDWIEVLSVNWGVEQPHLTLSGTPASLPEFHNLVLSKPLDAATPLLLDTAAKGAHIKTAMLSLCDMVNGNPQEYLRITLTDVIVTSMVIGGDRADGRPVDTVAFAFGKISVIYTKRGGASSTQVIFNWDLQTNKAF